MLYNLLCQKYGKPIEFRDNIYCLGKDMGYYIKNVSLFSEDKENIDEEFFSKWKVMRGSIEIDWWRDSLRLCYEDLYNTMYVEEHQQEFNMSSI